MTNPTHLFIIGADTVKAVSDSEVHATVEGLKALGLYHLPYPRVSLRLPSDCVCIVTEETMRRYPQNTFPSGDPVRDDHWISWKIDETGHPRTNFGPSHYAQWDNLNLLGEPMRGSFVHEIRGDGWLPYDIPDPTLIKHATLVIDFLITVLATKNTFKHTVRNKLARLGIGRKRPMGRFEYVTTISVPSDLEDDPTNPPQQGTAKAAHLRRGHIRRQHYGPAMQYIKQVWIAPVFVNADKDFISTRKAYNLGVTR